MSDTTRRGFLRSTVGLGAATAASTTAAAQTTTPTDGTATTDGTTTTGEGTAKTASGTTTAPSEPDYGGWFEGVSNYDGTVDRTGQSEVTVTVGAEGNDGNFAFGPAAIRIDPGTTVVWEWNGKGGAHNVVAENGDYRSGEPVTEAGTTFEHTFEEPGISKYYCGPHKSLGMKGAVVVAGGGGGDTGGGASVSMTPGLLMFAAGLALALFSPIALTIAMRNQRGRPREYDPGEPVEPAYPVTEEAPKQEVETEIDHEEFDPRGTFSMVLVYLAILVLMWVFMYFVEFLGNGPTVIG